MNSLAIRSSYEILFSIAQSIIASVTRSAYEYLYLVIIFLLSILVNFIVIELVRWAFVIILFLIIFLVIFTIPFFLVSSSVTIITILLSFSCSIGGTSDSLAALRLPHWLMIAILILILFSYLQNASFIAIFLIAFFIKFHFNILVSCSSWSSSSSILVPSSPRSFLLFLFSFFIFLLFAIFFAIEEII